MFSQVLKSFGLHLVSRQGVEGVDLDVIAQVGFQSKLIFQLDEDGFSVLFLLGQEFDLEGDVVEVPFLRNHYLEFIA